MNTSTLHDGDTPDAAATDRDANNAATSDSIGVTITFSAKQLQAVRADVVVVPLYEKVGATRGIVAAFDTALGASDGVPGDGAISSLLALGDISGRHGETHVLYPKGLIPATRVLLIGLGRPADISAERVRQASAIAIRRARELGCETVASAVLGAGVGGLDVAAAARATIEGARLGLYQFRAFKSQVSNARSKSVKTLRLVEHDRRKHDNARSGGRAGAILADAINAARDWINWPPNHLSPDAFARAAASVAESCGMRCEVLDERAIAALGMGSLSAAARGSLNPPRLVTLEHNPANSADRPALTLVGKGVTFDSGGYSIKTSDGMTTMKGDMGGAAAVLGAMRAISKLGFTMRIVAVLPMIENMIGGDAMRPGDIVKTLNGLTVEIVNTDAEGRLILCDALTYALRDKPTRLVDIATLTAQSSIAMGAGIAASLLSTNDALADGLIAAGAESGEKLWRMPLYPEYGEQIKSDYADIKNSAGLKGGLGATAYFLKRFVEAADGTAWAHIDMAGLAFTTSQHGYHLRGGAGFGVRTLVEFVERLARATPQL